MVLQKSNTIDHSFEYFLQKRALPGVLIVELSGEIVFTSDEAAKFLDDAVPKVKQNGALKTAHPLPPQLLAFCRDVSRQLSPARSADQSPPRQAMMFQSPSEQHYLIMALSLSRATSPNGRKLIFLVVQRIGQRKNFDPERLGAAYGLTKREQEVVTRLVQGDSNKEIAASLHIREYTVKDHLKHIMAKCHVGSRVSIISKAINL